MSQIEVAPLPDGVDQRSSWQVTKDGRRIGTFTVKRAASRRAREAARNGDTIITKGTNGEILDRSTYRGGSTDSSAEERQQNASTPYGLETFKTGISDVFR